MLESHMIYVIAVDVNDSKLLYKLFDVVAFTHVMHLAAQAGVRYAMENSYSYIHSNIAGLVTLLEISKSSDPQQAIIWASSSSVYGLNEKVPFSESDQIDQPASLYEGNHSHLQPHLRLPIRDLGSVAEGRRRMAANLRSIAEGFRSLGCD
ncbi:UDP-glucuronate 4-epimerase 1 [Linum perenne]